MRHEIRWQVSLSNGETLFEGKGSYQEIEGQPSPWQRLLLHLSDTKSRITSLSLYHDDGRRWNIPSAGSRPKFKAFYDAETPIAFDCFRKLSGDVTGENGAGNWDSFFTVARAEFLDGFLEVWVDEANPLNTWTIFLKK